MPCNHCEKEKPIVNVKYCLCGDCNSIRTTGKTLAERQAESVAKYAAKLVERNKDKPETQKPYIWKKKDTPTLPRTSIKQQTKKEAGIKSILSVVKNKIRLDAIQNGEYYCKGCGCTEVLDCSHILSVGQYKHLELLPENIQLMCRNQCHTTWESGDIQDQIELHCFADNILFIGKHDQTAYNKFITRIEGIDQYFLPEQKKKLVNDILNKVANVDNFISTN